MTPQPALSTASVEGFLTEARAVLDPPGVLVPGAGHAAELGAYTDDWTHRWSGPTAAVVRPRGTAEVAELVAAACRHGVPLVPQGGNTGLVGGSVPHRGEVVLSLRRLDHLEPVDELASQVTAEAGVTLERLQQHSAASGLAFGVDLAARGSATVGGMAATNAGGTHVVRYGSFRHQLVGVEAVLGNGQVVSRLSGLVKDNTGYDLAQLLCGSEGTLGIVTRVRLMLVPRPRDVAVAMVGLDSVAHAIDLAAHLRRELPGVRALELMTGTGLRLVADHLARTPPVAPDSGAVLLVEVDGDPQGEGLAGAVGGGAVSGLTDAAVATSVSERAGLWGWREVHSEVAVARARQRGTVVHKLDVTLPVAGLAEFATVVRDRLAQVWPDAELLLFGHVGDGNLHVNVVPGSPDSGGGADRDIDDLVLELVVERGGSISAEHGIGVAKRDWLARDRSPAEVEAMRAVKAALDPHGVLNPGVLL